MIKLVEYKHDSLIADLKKPCVIEEGFIPTMDKLCYYADKNELFLYHISSYRKTANVKGAIVTPAQMSNHMIGHAIDCNLLDGGKLWNSIEMRKGLTGNVKAFIDEVTKDKSMRWGGNFSKKDEVHFDDGLNIRNPKLWHEIFKAINK